MYEHYQILMRFQYFSFFNALEMKPFMMLSVVQTNISIFSCFSTFSEHVVLAWFPITLIIRITIAAASLSITASTTMIVDKSKLWLYPNLSLQHLEVSIELIILAHMLYFFSG